MNSPFKRRPNALAVLLMLGSVLVSSVVLSQGPPPGDGPGGFGGPPPGGPPMGGRRKPSVARIPVEFLATGLQLTAAQTSKIAQIQQTLRGNRPGGPGGPPPQEGEGPNGQPPNPQGMRGNMGQMQVMEQKAVKEVEAILTAEQRKQVPALLKEADALRQAGLPPVLSGRLALTAAQKQKIAALRGSGNGTPPDPKKIEQARKSGKFGAAWEASRSRGNGNGWEQGREKVLAVLTPEQRKAIAAFEKAHPRTQGGFGGPPPDGEGRGR